MDAYKLLIYTCMALAMAANATPMIRGMGVYTGNWTQPDLGNASTDPFGTRAASADENHLLKSINETATGPPDEQMTKNADMGNYAKVFEAQPQLANTDEVQANRAMAMEKTPLKGRAMRKLLNFMSEMEKLDEKEATTGKVAEKDYGRRKREHKDWDFATDSSVDQKDAPAEFVPTSAKSYRTFGAYGFHTRHISPYMLGHRKPYHHDKSKKYNRPEEAHIANMDKRYGAYANENEGKFQPEMCTMPTLPEVVMPPFAADYDNGRLHDGSQAAASNMGKMMREQRDGNENVKPYAHSQDPVDDFMNIETYDTPSARKLQENTDTFGLCDGSANDAAPPNTYPPRRILHKNRLAQKVPRRKHAVMHRIAPGGILMIIHGKGKVPAPEQIMQRMLPIVLKLRNEPLKAMEEHNEALQPEKDMSDIWPIAPLVKFGNTVLHKFGLGEAQLDKPQALPNLELHVHIPSDAASQMPNAAVKKNTFDAVGEWGQEYAKYNQHDVDPVHDERMGAARVEANAMPEGNSVLYPQAKYDFELDEMAKNLIGKSLQTITQDEQGENLTQEIQEVCPVHDSKANRGYGKGIVCSCRILKKRKNQSEPKELI